MKLVSMKLDPAEAKKDAAGDTPESMGDPPLYPYGLCICLDGDTMEKLGLGNPPEPGTVLTIAGNVEVVGFSMRKSQRGEDYRSLDLQITDLGVEGAGGRGAAQRLYGGKADS